METEDLDPICKLVSGNILLNQSYRLCVEVLRSSYFKDMIKYPIPWLDRQCRRKQVSFRTEEGIKEANGKSYYEFMVRCNSTIYESFYKVSFYISRAYTRNEVFVYSVRNEDRGDEVLYLENLSVNVGVVNEPIAFDDVE